MKRTQLVPIIALFVSLNLVSMSSFAVDIPVQVRLYAGGSTLTAEDMNTELIDSNLKKMSTAMNFGAEISYPLLSFFDVGIRYNKKIGISDEAPTDDLTNYYAGLGQEAYYLLTRIKFLRIANLELDAFAAYGGTNTTLKIITASQNGEITKKAETGWYANTANLVGASASIKLSQFRIVLEAGLETNRVASLDYTGTVDHDIGVIDLTGPYAGIAFQFDGVKTSGK